MAEWVPSHLTDPRAVRELREGISDNEYQESETDSIEIVFEDSSDNEILEEDFQEEDDKKDEEAKEVDSIPDLSKSFETQLSFDSTSSDSSKSSTSTLKIDKEAEKITDKAIKDIQRSLLQILRNEFSKASKLSKKHKDYSAHLNFYREQIMHIIRYINSINTDNFDAYIISLMISGIPDLKRSVLYNDCKIIEEKDLKDLKNSLRPVCNVLSIYLS